MKEAVAFVLFFLFIAGLIAFGVSTLTEALKVCV